MKLLKNIDGLGNYSMLVVGAGLFGATIAEHAAELLDKRVLVIDRRDHIAGNVYSYSDVETGIEVHKYGPHIFHTSNTTVERYVKRFTGLNDYQHRVFAMHNGIPYGLPINLHTLSQYFGRNVSPQEAQLLLQEPDRSAKSFEEAGISALGEDLYFSFFAGYTEKQWQEHPSSLPASTFSRLPVRFDFNNRYFNDSVEGIPSQGYTSWVERMLTHKNISVAVNTDFRSVKPHLPTGMPVVYSGPIDEYFEFKFGRLNWRTLDFRHEVLDMPSFQGVAQMNYPDLEIPWTRIVEHKHFKPEAASGDNTIITREFSRKATPQDEPYYPVRTPEQVDVFRRYSDAAAKEKGVIFGGRLGSFAYLDMDQVINSAIRTFNSKIRGLISPRT